MSILKRPINYVDLEEELEESFKADFKYQLENDAKLRAIEQKVPTYEHFRQMVNGAHLKPLERKDTDELTKVSWNLLMKKNPNANQLSLIKNSIISMTNKEFNSYIVSKSFEEFYKEWKKLDDIENKINFLQLSRDLLPEVFQVEIPINILMEFLHTCLHALTIMENQRLTLIFVIDILTSIATCNRFRLTINFLTTHDKIVCRQLFDKILIQGQDKSIETSRIIELAKKFEVML
ncbi:hypothetical protein PV327_008863 [Microctonus hyperodae]|uniref:Coiled-coil domain-containing protein 103 n=1 Tax=Microctonus hyperodae TaxID=165561 RepID=A0AA39FT74_MICHY|nr:hypothetical protein PV327_008863 [Microctonus hyperodae]